MEGRLLTAGEVADYLRVKRSWVYAETRAGRIPHVRLGRYVRYSPRAVERWIAKKAQIGGRGRGSQ
jgi:excisionase family DNA binding protein